MPQPPPNTSENNCKSRKSNKPKSQIVLKKDIWHYFYYLKAHLAYLGRVVSKVEGECLIGSTLLSTIAI